MQLINVSLSGKLTHLNNKIVFIRYEIMIDFCIVVTEKINEVTNEDLKEIEEVLDQLAEEKQFAIEKQELEELKEEVSEYQEVNMSIMSQRKSGGKYEHHESAKIRR